jgi:hypothetical protein
MTAVSSDTQFLADLNVIDYSLLVGLDATSGELVVGLVGMARFFFSWCDFLGWLIFFGLQIIFAPTRGTRNWRAGSRRREFWEAAVLSRRFCRPSSTGRGSRRPWTATFTSSATDDNPRMCTFFSRGILLSLFFPPLLRMHMYSLCSFSCSLTRHRERERERERERGRERLKDTPAAHPSRQALLGFSV